MEEWSLEQAAGEDPCKIWEEASWKGRKEAVALETETQVGKILAVEKCLSVQANAAGKDYRYHVIWTAYEVRLGYDEAFHFETLSGFVRLPCRGPRSQTFLVLPND